MAMRATSWINLGISLSTIHVFVPEPAPKSRWHPTKPRLNYIRISRDQTMHLTGF